MASAPPAVSARRSASRRPVPSVRLEGDCRIRLQLGSSKPPTHARLERHQADRRSAGRARSRSRGPARPAAAMLRATWSTQVVLPRPCGPPSRISSPAAEPAAEVVVERVEPGRPDARCRVRPPDAALGTSRTSLSDCIWRSTRPWQLSGVTRRGGTSANRPDAATGITDRAGRRSDAGFGARPGLRVRLSRRTRDRRLSRVPSSVDRRFRDSGRPAQVTRADLILGSVRALCPAPGRSSFPAVAARLDSTRKETHGAARQGSSRRGARGLVPGAPPALC